MSDCILLTSHGLVALCIYRNPEARLREIAESVGITERAVQRIISDLCAAGYLSRDRHGRQNSYELHLDEPLRHSLVSDSTLGELLDALAQPVAA